MSRKEFDDYRGDVTYEVWRNGGNVDRINDDRVRDSYDDGLYQDEAASRELRAMRPQPEPEYEDFGDYQ